MVEVKIFYNGIGCTSLGSIMLALFIRILIRLWVLASPSHTLVGCIKGLSKNVSSDWSGSFDLALYAVGQSKEFSVYLSTCPHNRHHGPLNVFPQQMAMGSSRVR